MKSTVRSNTKNQNSHRATGSATSVKRGTSSRHTAEVRSRAARKVMENRKKAFARSVKKAVFTVLFLSVIIGAYTVFEAMYLSPSVVHADECLSEIQYKVIEIQYGDTLWSIAKENMTPGFHDINDYIDEVMECNQLRSDRINEGCYLMIPYYEVLNKDTASVK